jgi:hypothetical protein
MMLLTPVGWLRGLTTLRCHTDFCVVADCGWRMTGVVGHQLWCCGMGGALVHTRLLVGLSTVLAATHCTATHATIGLHM